MAATRDATVPEYRLREQKGSRLCIVSGLVVIVKGESHLMKGVCAPAARACHADNLPNISVETPRTIGQLRTHSLRRRPLRD